MTDQSCVLMFSGGRDSTLAAVRLSQAFERLILVTVTSEHLVGISAVRARLQELRDRLIDAEWYHLKQPNLTEYAHDNDTCLPCHLAYAACGAAVLRHTGTTHMSFGYAGYQSSWPEQTPHAITLLRTALASHGITLHLPVYDVRTKRQAEDALIGHGLSHSALEQKCLIQHHDLGLSPEALNAKLKTWGSALAHILSDPPAMQLLSEPLMTLSAGE